MQVLPDGIRRSLKPIGAVNGLLRREHFDMSAIEWIEAIAVGHMTIQRSRVVLRQDEDSLQSGVETIADGNIDQAILSAKRDRGFGAVLSQRKQALSCATRQNNRNNMR